jgi:glucose-1-phosphate thymidylyltransferase
MNLIVFEDAGVDRLGAVTVGRPAYAVTCASFRLIDQLQTLDANLMGFVRPHLSLIQLNDFPQFSRQLNRHSPWTMVVNARMVPSVANIDLLRRMLDLTVDGRESSNQNRPIVARSSWAVAAALLPTATIDADDTEGIFQEVLSLGDGGSTDCDHHDAEFDLFEYAHDVVRFNMSCFGENLKQRIESGNYQQVSDGVFVADGKQPPASVVFDTSGGPILIESNVSLGPFSYVRGPVYVGQNVKISEHASIKDEVCISHTCKVGGEVEATVFEAYSNKQHYGFLGHSYVGSWVNLGAGTCNSDLKNTYGKVNVVCEGKKIATQMQFMGCIIGDYAKTAIQTAVFTGKQIGVGSMVYGWAVENVPSFVNYAQTFGSTSLMSPEVLITTQQRMFGRRSVEQRPCDIQLIHDMFRLTSGERSPDLNDEPPSF